MFHLVIVTPLIAGREAGGLVVVCVHRPSLLAVVACVALGCASPSEHIEVCGYGDGTVFGEFKSIVDVREEE